MMQVFGMALEVQNLTVTFPRLGRAVRDVSFVVPDGAAVGVVGESGAGKSAVLKHVLGLGQGTVEGSARWNGRELLGMSEPELARIRGAEIVLLVQSAAQALHPFQTVGEQLSRIVRRRRGGSRRDADQEALRLLDEVRFPDPKRRARDYPHQLSGGQAQRAYVAMAVAARPKLLIADEPTTALDAPIACEIVDLLRHLRESHGLGLVLVSHDLSVVARTCDEVLVMHEGRIVERGPTAEVLRHPEAPYTTRLVEAARAGQLLAS
jgi:ABC-type glutathione transport system ATPase component